MTYGWAVEAATRADIGGGQIPRGQVQRPELVARRRIRSTAARAGRNPAGGALARRWRHRRGRQSPARGETSVGGSSDEADRVCGGQREADDQERDEPAPFELRDSQRAHHQRAIAMPPMASTTWKMPRSSGMLRKASARSDDRQSVGSLHAGLVEAVHVGVVEPQGAAQRREHATQVRNERLHDNMIISSATG